MLTFRNDSITQIVSSMVVCAAVACAASVPVPNVTALPVTADSYPFGTSSKSLAAVDLAKAGYLEEEFLLTGTANVYDWAADGSLSVKSSAAPYGTRILVRRPAKAGRFSGTVVVEIVTQARRFDWPMMWGYMSNHIMESNDAWVGVTMPGSMQGVKKFNPQRYAALSFANPAPGAPCPGAGKGGPSDQEDGLRWDVLSQLAAALKRDGQLLGGAKGQFVYMTSGLQGADVVTYINAIHSHATLENGKPLYDGYLIKNAGGAGRINQCAAAPAAGDVRRNIADVNVPVMNVVAEGEVLASLAMRKADSDDLAGRFRQYEIAGAAHIDQDAFFAMPVLADQIAAVGTAQGTADWPLNAVCEPAIPLITHPLMRYALDGAFVGLDQWARKGVAPPKASLMEVSGAGTPQAKLAVNEFGALGGVRSLYVDAPVETYATGSAGPGTCRELGHVVPFDPARIQSVYGDRKKFAAKATQVVNRTVKERFFTESDGKRMKAEIK